MKIRQKFLAFVDYPDKLLLLMLVPASLFFAILLNFVSMRFLMSCLGHALGNEKLCMIATVEQVALARRIGRAGRTVGDNVPWSSRCLIEAAAVKLFLNLARIPSVIYLGARLDKASVDVAMKAHAWVTVGSCTVIGAPVHPGYQVVATFTSPGFDAAEPGT